MSRESVETVREAFAAFERGDIDRVRDLMADDLVTYRAEPDDATFHGKDGFFEAMVDWTEGWQDWKVEPLEYVAVGDDAVLIRVNQSALAGGSSVPIASEFWFAFRCRDGKIAWVSFHSNRDDAVEAVGLRA